MSADNRSKYLKKIPKVNLKGVKNSLSLIAESNSKAKNRRPEDFMDTSYVDELEKTGFIRVKDLLCCQHGKTKKQILRLGSESHRS